MNKIPNIFKNRMIIIIFLLVVLFVLCSNYYNNYKLHREYPSFENILTNYPQGSMVFVSGNVIGVYNGGFYLKEGNEQLNLIYNINSSFPVEITDHVSVLGVLGPSYQIDASKILITKKWKREFVHLRSAIGGILLIIIFLIYWKFDFKHWEFSRRGK